ncbi:hypothetical protein G4Z16_09295 [Streptomyces bathyalis]|uniref:Uncharacterized protein n=1 Tax=Streptomyces bathyalis TaxID=2710756 RepID=A0A7T1WRI7_9ACTN|nr:hypothetical protein [Streptomyces bathyalis]QPP06564.1 hypothetical protein G4Z16_09295 [Streptomyces bathyalis]
MDAIVAALAGAFVGFAGTHSVEYLKNHLAEINKARDAVKCNEVQAKERLVYKLRVVNEWSRLVKMSVDATVRDLLEKESRLRVSDLYLLLRQSDAYDVVRALGVGNRDLEQHFDEFKTLASQYFDLAFQVNKMCELTRTPPLNHNVEVRQLQNLFGDVCAKRSELKECLMRTAAEFDGDLLIGQSGHWGDFVRNNGILSHHEMENPH